MRATAWTIQTPRYSQKLVKPKFHDERRHFPKKNDFPENPMTLTVLRKVPASSNILKQHRFSTQPSEIQRPEHFRTPSLLINTLPNLGVMCM